MRMPIKSIAVTGFLITALLISGCSDSKGERSDADFSSESSVLNLVSYYHSQPNGAALPNHCSIKTTEYEGETKLGNGVVYILNCDSEGNSTYDRLFALIPIEGEDKAYSLDVPLLQEENRENDIKKVISLLK
ncbi:hypothetical protein [Paenibacillus sp. MMS18-CY102]|uniref:hypothetical protein n=1 Tax=Paenibacillus sp. MMS18-CY102 TaxID=2682849 RepID=UPI00136594D4|nr:hypothetical protein [Paenibacillus sp. MMS18-CY102]MWC30147.1 hypothetical protein [Paenibacillus sp. MMS18-CY102]